jgi:glycosyltransferase involved in cell wall biosynthesis
MRVAFVTTEYPTEERFAGGLASYLRRVTAALIEGGHNAEVFTLSHRAERTWDGSTLVHRVKRQTRFRTILGKAPYFRRGAGHADVILPSLSLAAALHQRHQKAPFDVVQAPNYRACGLVAAFWNRIPVVTRISSYEPSWRAMSGKPLTRRQRFLEKTEILQVRWSAAMYAPSVLLSDTLKLKEGLDVRVIEPPFSLDPPPPGLPPLCNGLTPDGYALFFGFIGQLKGCDRLVNVLPRLLDRNPDLKFVFIGPAGSAVRFDDHIRQALHAYIDQRVFVLGQQRHSTLLPFVQNARLVVLPSRVDNLPNACLEAMALRRVVIGTYGASFEQLIEDGVNGFLVSQGNDDGLMSCMERVWRMPPQERDRIGDRAVQTLRRMRPVHAIRPLVTLFEEVTRQPRQRSARQRLNTLLRLPALMR